MKLLLICVFILLIKLINGGILTGLQLPSPGAKHGANFDDHHSRGLIGELYWYIVFNKSLTQKNKIIF